MPLYSDLINIEGEYNYSANIQFDIENDRKLLRFIPNETTIDLLKEYFIDITKESSSHHARMLYGSYGTGKSHFLTVLSMLLGKIHTDGIAYKSFLNKVAKFDKGLSADIDNYIVDTTRKPLLVVPIVFDFDDFDRCLYFSLKKKLDLIGRKVSFKTFYDQALQLVNQWENNHDSQIRLKDACAKVSIDLDALKDMLRLLDKGAESIFQQVFSEMTYGVKYIYEVSNISENINQANIALSDEYSGIVFIFDEFGRYIEDNIKSIKVKAVQDLAEYCDHCDGNNHIILVSHKEIGQYTQRFGKNVTNEWKKVEGRYKATPINDKQDQCLSLIGNILTKQEETWTLFKQTFGSELNKMYAEASDFRGFLIDAAQGENPFEGGFPLHPISLFALDKLSKRVAQNERTFFTYLASKDDNSLFRFLTRNDLEKFHFVGIDEIYDYFEPSIKSTQSDSGYEWYKELQTALSKCKVISNDNTPETKILKVIATIGIINDASALVANKSTILSVIDCPKEIISNALEELCERKVIKYSGAYDRYDFFEASIFDVDEMIATESQSVSDEAVVNTLNDEFVNFVLYPYEYNRTYKISRVFFPVFATYQDLQKKSFGNKFGKYYDGLLIMLLADTETQLGDICAISAELPRAIVFANNDIYELKNAVKSYIAVKYLESRKTKYTEKDPAFEKELQYFREELHVEILSAIQSWKENYGDSTLIVSSGEILESVHSSASLSSAASSIMEAYYPETLIVNNELINKNVISGSITSAKKNVISNAIKGCKPAEYYEVQYLSPDYIAVRSVLVKNGFIESEENVEQNALPDGRMPQNAVKGIITQYVNRGKTETVTFEELITALKEPPFGLRNGYLSLLISHVLVPHRKSLIISSHGVEQEITVDLFEEIVRRPADYSFTIANWDSEQTDYLDALEHMYSDYINEASLSKNRLKAIYDAMMSHYKNVSKFARTTQTYVSDDAKNYRRILEKSTANYSTFLFAKVKSIGGSYDLTVQILQQIKSELDGAIAALARDLAAETCKILDAPENTLLSDMFCKKYSDEWKVKRAKSFDYYTNSFLDFASKIQNKEDDFSVVSKLSKSLTGFELVYWNDSHKDTFIEQLNNVKDRLASYKETEALNEGETKMILKTASGSEKSIVFDRGELSPLSQTVKNKIISTFGNYGLAISYEEKVQVLLSLIEDLVEGK